MRLRICCCCDGKEKETTPFDGITRSSRPPSVAVVPIVTEQPKPAETIQLDKITEVSAEESSVPAIIEEQPTPVCPAPVTPPPPEIVNKPSNQTEPSTVPMPEPRYIPPRQQPLASDSSNSSNSFGSNLNFTSTIGNKEVTFQSFGPGLFEGTFKGSQFTIINGQFFSTSDVYSDLDREIILTIYSKAMLAVQPNALGMRPGLLAANPLLSQHQVPATVPIPEPRNIPPRPQPFASDSSNSFNSDFNFTSTIGNKEVTFQNIGPGLFEGTFKGSRFTIINGQFYSSSNVYSDVDKEVILNIYSDAMKGMQRGVLGMRAGLLTAKPLLSEHDVALAPGTTINVNCKTDNGEVEKMPLTVIAPGHFRCTFRGKEFSIVNGQVHTMDGADNDPDMEYILWNYNTAITGMQKGILGMQRGLLNMGLTSNVYSPQPSYDVLTTGQETLKRMRSLNHGKRVSVLQGGLISEPRDSLVIEDAIEKSKKAKLIDECDAYLSSTLTEPALTKTTFTPKAIIYDDPKTYEKLDKNEIPSAKRLDDYIISLDESVKSGNRYYFHDAKPKRVNRKQLTAQELLQLASLERFSLFESESVKAHNKLRKMHGVPPLVNSEFLCQVAREWAEHLALKDAFYHRPNNDYGENLYYADGLAVSAARAAQEWYDEIDLYDYNNPKFSKETGHFTQLVWKDTREMGTGVAQFGDKIWVCCNYHPPGNVLNKFNDEYIPRPVMKKIKK